MLYQKFFYYLIKLLLSFIFYLFFNILIKSILNKSTLKLDVFVIISILPLFFTIEKLFIL